MRLAQIQRNGGNSSLPLSWFAWEGLLSIHKHQHTERRAKAGGFPGHWLNRAHEPGLHEISIEGSEQEHQ